ncbi:YbhB/YbcL family Raf kinase inhibitor-like protein [Legionella impletisoli]|uniref:Phosphatidylethanolamine-binding protein n=1 Tax=Legionella impletisoli TaxID=343510 RepID=A0A917JPY0_9GAMM|nr:YbhB/YbcL family Raf kinase inhibitor-like protein [Legionella impletisoli]GGI76784.1 hypothetical protein GCM10007966_01870 [Legionella impletisoli]
MAFTLTSEAFKNNGNIPVKYTCQGEDRSPPLTWSNVPDGTQSFVLIVDDPDAQSGNWVHWVLFNISQSIHGLDENTTLPSGATSGLNSWDKTGYGGPCPPSGTHRYQFKLYALDTTLSLGSEARKTDIMNAMQNHILAETKLVGLYSKT